MPQFLDRTGCGKKFATRERTAQTKTLLTRRVSVVPCPQSRKRPRRIHALPEDVDTADAWRARPAYARSMAAPLPDVLDVLQRLAPLHLAEDWDNVGLLVEPRPASSAGVSRVLCTIDLTEGVLAEAREREAELVIAYHPPIFSGLKRLTQATASERVVLRLLTGGHFVYSPHTALDAARDGLNDWLARAFGRAVVRPIVPNSERSEEGAGRLIDLERALHLDDAVTRLKAHLGIDHLRVARANAENQAVRKIAICAGAGGSVLTAAERSDLWVSGELRHHDILASVQNGTSVIVTDHTHSERGYLPILAERLEEALDSRVVCQVSDVDDDPLIVT